MELAKRVEQPDKNSKLPAFQKGQFFPKITDVSPFLFSTLRVTYDQLHHIKVISNGKRS